MKIRRSVAMFGLASSMVLGAANIAVADDPQPAPSLFTNGVSQAIRGTGSDTTFSLMNELGEKYQESPGCDQNVPTMPNDATVQERTCKATQPVGVITTENYDKEVHFGWHPQGSGNGVRQLCKQTNPRPTNVPPVNYARSSASAANTSASNCTAGVTLRFVAYAKDGIAWVNWAGGAGSGVTNLTQAQINDIWVDCLIRDWSEVGGSAGPIVVYTAQGGSGTRSTWDAFAGGNTTSCIPPQYKDGDTSNGERVIFENNCIPAQSALNDPDPVAANEGNAIFPYSFGAYRVKGAAETCRLQSINGVAASEPTILDGSFPFTRFVYNAFRISPSPDPRVSPFTAGFVGENGWICKPGNQHTQPPNGIAGDGIESSNTTTDYGKLVQDTIRSDGFVPILPDSNVTGNRCSFTDKTF